MDITHCVTPSGPYFSMSQAIKKHEQIKCDPVFCPSPHGLYFHGLVGLRTIPLKTLQR